MRHDTLNDTVRQIRDILDEAVGKQSAAAGACCATSSKGGCCTDDREPGCCASTVAVECGCR